MDCHRISQDRVFKGKNLKVFDDKCSQISRKKLNCVKMDKSKRTCERM